jgi:hypothetical protein
LTGGIVSRVAWTHTRTVAPPGRRRRSTRSLFRPPLGVSSSNTSAGGGALPSADVSFTGEGRCGLFSADVGSVGGEMGRSSEDASIANATSSSVFSCRNHDHVFEIHRGK